MASFPTLVPDSLAMPQSEVSVKRDLVHPFLACPCHTGPCVQFRQAVPCADSEIGGRCPSLADVFSAYCGPLSTRLPPQKLEELWSMSLSALLMSEQKR